MDALIIIAIIVFGLLGLGVVVGFIAMGGSIGGAIGKSVADAWQPESRD